MREILYDFDEELISKIKENDENLIRHFKYKLKEGDTYNIKLFGEKKIYSLEIDRILLNVYRTGTAVLSFHLRNHNYPAQEDILKINKFGRRLYVPFFDLEPDSIFTGQPDITKKDQLLFATKKNEVPDAMWIGKKKFEVEDKTRYEDFENYRESSNYKNDPFLLPKFIKGLFPEYFFLINDKNIILSNNDKKDKQNKIHISPVLDDRMYVICWYGNSNLANELNQVSICNDFDIEPSYINDNRNKKNHYTFEEHPWWYSYIFADTSPMFTDKFKQCELVRDSSYTRWISYGTLFGISRYSFVMISYGFSDLKNYGTTYLVRHLQSMYFKMAELTIAGLRS